MNTYDVLSPWAEADTIPPRGILPRLTDLKDKKIGLFCNSKRASKPIMKIVEEEFRKKFPDTELNWYLPKLNIKYQILQTESENKSEFKQWLKEVDAVIAAVGD